MMDLRGIEVNTDEVQIDTEALMELYEELVKASVGCKRED